MWRGGEKLLGSGYRTGFGVESEGDNLYVGGIRYLALLMMMMVVMTMMVMMEKKV